MIRITDKSECCGCSACYAACPYDAIVMKADGMGFLYPEVDHDRCTGCGVCEKVCVFGGLPGPSGTDAFAVRNRDEDELMESRSGAVFPVLARKVIDEGGTVYGAGYDEGFKVVHKCAETMADAEEFRGSKYVQSDMRDMFRKVRNDLKEGRRVLFSGTPCQAAGLRSFLPVSLQDNLLLVDIVCHGVPSPRVWMDYLAYQEKKHGGTVTSLSFRDKKSFGWKAHKESFTIGDEVYAESSYTYLFSEDLILRDSCHVCPYSCTERVSDLTLADFWGWQDVVPGFNDDDKGVSLVLVNTGEGRRCMDDCDAAFEIRPVSLERCLQPNLKHPSRPGRNREAFIRRYLSDGLEKAMKRYGDTGWRYMLYSAYMNIKRRVRSALKV